MSYAAHESATRQSQGEAITAEEIASSGSHADEPTARYALILGDDALIASQQLGHWISRGPELEEDVALGNIALDLLGHARFLLSYAGTAWDRSEDDLAYFRDEEDFRSCRLVEQDNGDFGATIARQLIFSLYQHRLYGELQASADPTLAAIAAKAVKEVAYHRDHAVQWVRRLGLGTAESHRRMQAGLERMCPHAQELFADVEEIGRLPVIGEQNEGGRLGVAVRPSALREPVLQELSAVIESSGLQVPDLTGVYGADRSGRFSEQRGYILAEMQVLARRFPGASW